jgi:hypothetical protein
VARASGVSEEDFIAELVLKRHVLLAVAWRRRRLALEIGGVPRPSRAAPLSRVRYPCSRERRGRLLPSALNFFGPLQQPLL